MTIIEALKKFYEGNAYNEQELKEADNVLDVIRAKYGPYKGSNVAEYLQTAMANGITPGSGGGSSGGTVIPTFVVDDTDPYAMTYTCDVEFDDWIALIEGSPYKNADNEKIYPAYDSGTNIFIDASTSIAEGENVVVIADAYCLFADGTIQQRDK